MLTTDKAYELGFSHGSEMARESGSADAGPNGWDGMLINADAKFARESLGWESGNGEVMAAYVRGAQDGADSAVKSLTTESVTVSEHNIPEVGCSYFWLETIDQRGVERHLFQLDEPGFTGRDARDGLVSYNRGRVSIVSVTPGKMLNRVLRGFDVCFNRL